MTFAEQLKLWTSESTNPKFLKSSRRRRVMIPIEQRFMGFFTKIAPSDCWNWTGAKQTDGYGVIRTNGHHAKSVQAHRLSQWIFNGDFPNALCVLHKCDNPSCVNPDHLFVGTKKDNERDMTEKGRRAVLSGERGANAKLTNADVIAIIRSKGRARASDLAARFRVSFQQIYKIWKGDRWAHLALRPAKGGK